VAVQTKLVTKYINKRNNTKHSTNNTKHSKYKYTITKTNEHYKIYTYTHPHITKQVKITTVQVTITTVQVTITTVQDIPK
jgi:hypothetical protein